MKKWVFIIFFSFILGGLGLPIFASEQIEINFFYSRTCPHCAQESKFLDKLEKEYPEVKILRYISSDRENIELLNKLYDDYDVDERIRGWVPIIFIKDRYFIGFDSKIKNQIENCVLSLRQDNDQQSCPSDNKIKIPFIGELDVAKYSLPVLSVILGALDGFNVCSLGALILILGLVLALKSRKKVLIFGGLFILTTAVVYGLLIVLWYQLFFIFALYFKFMELLIGILALAGSLYFWNQFLKMRKQGVVCEVDSGKKMMSKFSSKFQEKLKESKNILVVIGLIFVFAAVVTIVEFPCSAAIPVVFAGILADAQLSSFLYLFYIFLFVFFYMVDEIIIFLIAFFTMKIWLASSKVTIWITLAESLILFLLGFYYLFGFDIFM